MAWLAMSRSSTSSGSTSRIPRGGAVGSLLATLLPRGHDDLRLAGRPEVVVEADDGRDEGWRILAVNGPQPGDDAFEAGVDGLHPIARRPAEQDGQVAVELVLRNDDLLDPIPVEIHGQRHRLETEEFTPAAALGTRLDQFDFEVAASAHRGGRAKRLLRLGGHAEAILLVDEDEASHRLPLAGDVRQGRPRRAERGRHAGRTVSDELVALECVASRLPLSEERLRAERLPPQRLLEPAALGVDDIQELRAVGVDLGRFAAPGAYDERGQ